VSTVILRTLFAGNLALAAIVLLWSLAQALLTALRRLRLLRGRTWKAPQTQAAQTFDPYGLDTVPWEGLRLVGAALGCGLAAALFWERQPALTVLGLLGGFVPSLLRTYLLRRAQQLQEAQVRHFLRFLRSGSTLYGGLMPALRAVARYGQGLVQQRLQTHLRVALTADEALERLATDLRSPTLQALTKRLHEAHEGRARPEAVLNALLIQAEQDHLTAAKEQIGSAPFRLLIPMLILMVPPILILALYPPVARLIALITSTGGAGPLW